MSSTRSGRNVPCEAGLAASVSVAVSPSFLPCKQSQLLHVTRVCCEHNMFVMIIGVPYW